MTPKREDTELVVKSFFRREIFGLPLRLTKFSLCIRYRSKDLCVDFRVSHQQEIFKNRVI